MGKWHKKPATFLTSFVLAGSIFGTSVEAAPITAVKTATPVSKSVLSVEIEEATIFELQHEMQKGTLTSEQLVQFYLDRIEEYDDTIHSIITIDDDVLEEARQLDSERKAGKVRGALHGIPVILKDNYDTYDMPTTAGSLSLEGSIPLDDAYQTNSLRELVP
jgi:amidase